MNQDHASPMDRRSALQLLLSGAFALTASYSTALGGEEAATLAATLTWLRGLPAIEGAPADRFQKLSVDDLRELREIRLGGHRQSDKKHVELAAAEFRFLAALPALSIARLSEIHGLDDVALKHIGKITTLTQLEMGDAQISSAGLAELSRLNSLTHLNVAFARQVDDRGIPHLGRMRKLELLVISGTQITDSGLAALPELPQLTELRIKATPITDVGLLHLRRHPKLKTVRIAGKGKITPAGIMELQKHLPGCQVML